MSEKIRLAILGATGMAGREALLHQEFLDNVGRQYAEITCITASEKSAGREIGRIFGEKEKKLASAYSFWKQQKCPESLSGLIVDSTEVDVIAKKADYAISALDTDVANTVEPALTAKGVNVFSNASSFRWNSEVPLLIPEVNYDHLDFAARQTTKGRQFCNPNCTASGFVPLIRALWDMDYEINSISLVTQQSLSGKGDSISEPEYIQRTIGNVKDDWTKEGFNAEEWKSACEPQKILGRLKAKETAIEEYEKVKRGETSSYILPIFTQTTRVLTQYGHLEYLCIDFADKVDAKKVAEGLAAYHISEPVAKLPTTPEHLFVVQDRMPEPLKDVYAGNGMSIVVGDIQQHTPNKISLWTLSHNLRRGATWAGRQGLELYLTQIERRKI